MNEEKDKGGKRGQARACASSLDCLTLVRLPTANGVGNADNDDTGPSGFALGGSGKQVCYMFGQKTPISDRKTEGGP
jgi:hypothetical protein